MIGHEVVILHSLNTAVFAASFPVHHQLEWGGGGGGRGGGHVINGELSQGFSIFFIERVSIVCHGMPIYAI